MIKLYHVNGPIWWNTGNEIKPNDNAVNKLQFIECTNFNISWETETTIRVIVPSNQITGMIKIVDDSQAPVDKYFYLLEVLDRTTVNHECIYELDIWMTYLLPNLTEIRSIRTLDVNTLSPNVNIEPVGVPTGNIAVESVSFDNSIEEGLNREYPTDEPIVANQELFPGITTNIYYVFKSKPPTTKGPITVWNSNKYIGKLPNYILVPLLNLEGYGFTKNYDIAYYTSGTTSVPADVLNSYTNINVLINNNTDFGASQGLGEFIGIWVGPNYFRLKEKGIPILQYDFGAAWNTGSASSLRPTALTQDILVDYNKNSAFYLSHNHNTGKGTFLALRVDSMPLSLQPLNIDKSLFLRGLRFQENQENHLTISANSVNFNQAFNYTNGVETTSVNLQIPIAYDAYYNTLEQQRNTLNTSLNLSGVNSVIQGLSALTGFIPPEPSTSTSINKTTRDYQAPTAIAGFKKERLSARGKRGGLINMGWKQTNDLIRPPIQKLTTTRENTRVSTPAFGLPNMLGATFGTINAGMQFISTLANQKAYRNDLRTKLSAAVLNSNDKYVSWYKIAKQIPALTNTANQRTEEFIRNISKEILAGAETEPGISYKFYGVDSQPQNIEILADTEAYIQVDENTALSLQNSWGALYTPTIKEAMLSLLTNGIRLSGGKIK